MRGPQRFWRSCRHLFRLLECISQIKASYKRLQSANQKNQREVRVRGLGLDRKQQLIGFLWWLSSTSLVVPWLLSSWLIPFSLFRDRSERIFLTLRRELFFWCLEEDHSSKHSSLLFFLFTGIERFLLWLTLMKLLYLLLSCWLRMCLQQSQAAYRLPRHALKVSIYSSQLFTAYNSISLCSADIASVSAKNFRTALGSVRTSFAADPALRGRCLEMGLAGVVFWCWKRQGSIKDCAEGLLSYHWAMVRWFWMNRQYSVAREGICWSSCWLMACMC